MKLLVAVAAGLVLYHFTGHHAVPTEAKGLAIGAAALLTIWFGLVTVNRA